MRFIAVIVGPVLDWLDRHLPGAANRHIGRVLEQHGLCP
jgi:hypothetical protein